MVRLAHALCLEGVCSTWEPSDEALKRANKHSARALAERTCVVTNLPRFFHTSVVLLHGSPRLPQETTSG